MDLIGGLGLFLLGSVVMAGGLRALTGDATRRWLIRFTRSPCSGALSGAACTALLQSSSATTVAATLTGLNAGIVDFPQAAALVIGADVGTTATALIAATGASVNARRTGLSVVMSPGFGSLALPDTYGDRQRWLVSNLRYTVVPLLLVPADG